MDAIKYWVYTKRAPCLYKYDLVSRKRIKEVIYSSKLDDSLEEKPTYYSKNKKDKRKLSILNDSNSSNSQQNVFFEKTNQVQINKSALTTFISDKSVLSKSCLNIVNSKRPSSDSSLHKNLKQIPSTSTYDIITSTPIIRNNQSLYGQNNTNENNRVKRLERKKSTKLQAKNSEESINEDSRGNCTFSTDNRKCHTQKGVFEDGMSDVSGFTANYIRSTKLISSKCKTNILQRRKMSKQLINTSRNPGHKITQKNTQWINQSMDSDDDTHNMVLTSHGLFNSNSAQSNMSQVNRSKRNTQNGRSGQKEIITFLNAKDDYTNKLDENCNINSSSDESIFRNKSKINSGYRRRRFERAQFPSKTNSQNVGIAAVKHEFCVTLPKNKRSILVTSNSLEPACSTMSTLGLSCLQHSKDRCLRKRPSAQSMRHHDVSSCENSLLVKNSSMVPQDWSKSQLTACFSDSDEDVPNRRQKYFH